MYQRPLHPGELMHYGVPGMKWGIRKTTKEVKRIQRSTIRKMKKVNHLKNAMRMQLHYRKDTLKLIDMSNKARGKGQIFRANVYDKIMKTTNPLRTLATKRVDHLEKQISNNMKKVSEMSLKMSESYINIGRNYLVDLEEELDRRKGLKV